MHIVLRLQYTKFWLLYSLKVTFIYDFISGVPVYLASWAACPLGVKLPLGSLPPGGEETPGYLAPTLGSLPPGSEDTLAWAACPPPQENLAELMFLK